MPKYFVILSFVKRFSKRKVFHNNCFCPPYWLLRILCQTIHVFVRFQSHDYIEILRFVNIGPQTIEKCVFVYENCLHVQKTNPFFSL